MLAAVQNSIFATIPSIDGSHSFELSHQLPPKSVTKHDKCEPTPVMVDKSTNYALIKDVHPDDIPDVDPKDLPTDEEGWRRWFESIEFVQNSSAPASTYGQDVRGTMTDKLTKFDEDMGDESESSDTITPFLDPSDQDDATSLYTATKVDEPNGKYPELPEHVNVLFIQTMSERQLSKDAEEGLKPVSYTHLTLPTNREV